jgi:hypothetical protein
VIVLSNVTAAIVSNNSIPLLLFLKVATHISNWRNGVSGIAYWWRPRQPKKEALGVYYHLELKLRVNEMIMQILLRDG